MARYLSFYELRDALNKALKQDEKQVTITLPKEQAELLLAHVEYRVEREEYPDR